MKFGIHNPSWLSGPDPAEAFEAAKAKVRWAEDHGFVWFSVMDHLIQIPGVGRARRAVSGGLDRTLGIGRGDEPDSPRHARHLGRLPQSRAPRQDRRRCRSDQPGPADLGHRRRLFRDRIPAIWLGVPGAAGGAHPPDGGSRPADPGAMDRARGPPFTADIFMSRMRSSSPSRCKSRTRRC